MAGSRSSRGTRLRWSRMRPSPHVDVLAEIGNLGLEGRIRVQPHVAAVMDERGRNDVIQVIVLEPRHNHGQDQLLAMRQGRMGKPGRQRVKWIVKASHTTGSRSRPGPGSAARSCRGSRNQP